MKRVYVNEEYCMGCGLCQVYCRTQHSKSKDIIKAHKKEEPKPISRIFVEKEAPVASSVRCMHCDDAPCIDGCITGAIRKDEESGAVIIDEDKCVGCWACIMVCPLGAIRRNTEVGIASKCDLCAGEEFPACVENCPNEALEYR